MDTVVKELVATGTIVAGCGAASWAYKNGCEYLAEAVGPKFNRSINGTRRFKQKTLPKWGLISSLWVGIPVAFAARVGSNGIASQELVKPVALAYGVPLALGALAGLYGYMQTPDSEYADEPRDQATDNAWCTAAVSGIDQPGRLDWIYSI
ncbi:hypothetical protein BH09DEP1_BH09DEP1_4830 [soil metagenome]